MGSIDARGVVFSSLEAGQGELILLLHGFPQTSAAWRAYLPALAAAGYRAVAPDQRGYAAGARPQEVERYALPELCLDVVAMAESVGVERFHIVGHDWGATVAWAVAAQRPDLVQSLTAVSLPHPAAFAAAIAAGGEQARRSGYIDFLKQPDKPEDFLVSRRCAGLRKIYSGLGMPDDAGALVDEYLELLSERSVLTAALNWYRAASHELLSAVPPVSVPTTYVFGDADETVADESRELMHQFITGQFHCEKVIGGGHWLPEANRDLLLQLILSRVSGC